MEVRAGTRVLVTGASRGIGRAFCEAFAARGATMGLVSRSEDELRELAAALPAPAEGRTRSWSPTSVTRTRSPPRSSASARSTW